MPNPAQSYESHRRFFPIWHYFAAPLLVINVIVEAVRFFREPAPYTGWRIAAALAILVAAVGARGMSLLLQNRLIRLEERLRLERVLPAELRARIGELSTRQLIGLRFAPDDELPDLTRRTLAGELPPIDAIKRAVRQWRPDHMRV